MDPQATRFLLESLCSAATKATISQTPNMEPKESKELRTEQKKISPCAAELICSVMMLWTGLQSAHRPGLADW